MRTLAILNPVAAGGRHARARRAIEHGLRAHLGRLELVETQAPAHATTLTREALLAGFDRIVAIGGDGTANEVVNGFFDARGQRLRPEAVLGLVPMGTGMDFRRTVGLSTVLDDAAARIAQLRVREVDVGGVASADGTRRFFLNVASIGVSAAVIERVEQAQWLKRFANPLAFGVAAVRAVLAQAPMPAEVVVDAHPPVVADIALCAICNGAWFGGGMHIAPGAEVDDGWLDVVIAAGFGRAQMVAALRHLYRGTHAAIPQVRVLRGRRVEVRPQRAGSGHRFELDGQLGQPAPAVITLTPRALRLLV